MLAGYLYISLLYSFNNTILNSNLKNITIKSRILNLNLKLDFYCCVATAEVTATATAAMQSHVVATANGSCNVQKLQLQQQQYIHTHTHSETKEIMLAITFTCLDECVWMCVCVPNLYTNCADCNSQQRSNFHFSQMCIEKTNRNLRYR